MRGITQDLHSCSLYVLLYIIQTQYKVYHHLEFDKKDFPSHSYCKIRVLEFLNGKPWNNMAANYLMALRPSYVRVTKGEITLDSCLWRVTVYIDNNNIIEYIEQEVEAGLIGIVNGSHLYQHRFLI